MTYHSLSECTLSPEERLQEAVKIANILYKEADPESFTQSEQRIVNSFFEEKERFCSVKQLFWLRDIKDKYL